MMTMIQGLITCLLKAMIYDDNDSGSDHMFAKGYDL